MGEFLQSDGISVVDQNYSVCQEDTSPPEIIITALNTTSCTKVGVALTCEDAIGCKNFNYGTHATSSLCQAVNDYGGQNILLNKTGWVCYQGED